MSLRHPSLLSLLVALGCFACVGPRAPSHAGAGTGAVLAAGGGTLPDVVLERFVDLAGGREARVVLIPTASATADDPEAVARMVQRMQRHPVAEVIVLHTREREIADRAEFSRPLTQATGVWLSGGDQSRLTEAYLGTKVEHHIKEILRRGGVVGGTSAGAAVLTRIMIAGGRETPVLAEGFDLLPDTIVDQHFTERRRLPRLLAAVERHPFRTGLGIDEGTAVLWRGGTIEVLGRGNVTLVQGIVVDPGTRHMDRRVEVMVPGTVRALVAKDTPED